MVWERYHHVILRAIAYSYINTCELIYNIYYIKQTAFLRSVGIVE